jgi:hypothetical protein
VHPLPAVVTMPSSCPGPCQTIPLSGNGISPSTVPSGAIRRSRLAPSAYSASTSSVPMSATEKSTQSPAGTSSRQAEPSSGIATTLPLAAPWSVTATKSLPITVPRKCPVALRRNGTQSELFSRSRR